MQKDGKHRKALPSFSHSQSITPYMKLFFTLLFLAISAFQSVCAWAVCCPNANFAVRGFK